MTGKSRPIAVALAVITASQLALGIYMTFVAATHAGEAWALVGSLVSPFQLINYHSGDHPQNSL